MDHVPVKYVAFDPGIATGIAEFDEKGILQLFDILKGDKKLDEYLDKLESEHTVDVVIYEEYRVGHSHSQLLTDKYSTIHGGKSVPTEQAIGNILRTARRLNAKIVKQQPRILSVAQLWSGVKIPTNHDKSHGIVALNHGIYYLTQQKIIKPRVLEMQQDIDKQGC